MEIAPLVWTNIYVEVRHLIIGNDITTFMLNIQNVMAFNVLLLLPLEIRKGGFYSNKIKSIR